MIIQFTYKKVLLRERKRLTARRVASARYAALSPDMGGGGSVPHPVMDGRGYPIQSWTGDGGTPSSLGQWVPIQSWMREGVPHPVLDGGVPHPVLDGGGVGTPSSFGWGYSSHPDLGWEYPRLDLGLGTPPHPDLGWVPPLSAGWGTPLSAGWGTPPPKVGQTHTCENVTSRHPSDAGGKKRKPLLIVSRIYSLLTLITFKQ